MKSKLRPRITPVSWLPYAEVNGGTPSTLAEFRNSLSAFSRDPMLRLCATMNNLMYGLKPNPDPAAHGLFLGQLCGQGSTYLSRIRQFDGNRAVFHRQQFLLIAKEALSNCPVEGRPPAPGDDLMRVFLMANDHMFFDSAPRANEDDEIIRLMGEFLANLEGSRFNSYLPKLSRPLLLLSHVWKPTDPFDLPSLFQTATGLTIPVYFGLVLAASVARTTQLSISSFAANPQTFGVDAGWFVDTRITPSDAAKFLEDVSADPVELKGIVGRLSRGPNDLTAFKEKPLLRLDNRFLPVDTYLFAEKCDASLFWRIHNTLPSGERQRFHSYWGDLFERYVNWLLEQSVDQKRNKFDASPHYADEVNKQVCDGVINCRDGIVLLEYKGTTFGDVSMEVGT